LSIKLSFVFKISEKALVIRPAETATTPQANKNDGARE